MFQLKLDDPAGSGAGINFDVCSSNTATLSPLAFSHTIGGEDDRLLVVGIGIEGTSSPDVTAVTYNGVALTKAIDVQVGSTTITLSELWYMLETDLPSTGSYMVSISASGSITDIDAGGSIQDEVTSKPETIVMSSASILNPGIGANAATA